jgi:hypothetical protein
VATKCEVHHNNPSSQLPRHKLYRLGKLVPFSDSLAGKTAELLIDFEKSKVYKQFFSSRADSEFVKAAVGGLLFEVGSYGPFITSATFTGIGRLSHLLSDVRPLMTVVEDELPHPRLALQDSCGLCATTGDGPSPTLSSAAFSVAAVARMIAEFEHPAAFLGYIYLLESTTAELAPRVKSMLDAAGLDVPFVSVHAVEDVAHTARLSRIIDSVVDEIPEAAQAIGLGFDYSSAVYPIPIWKSGYRRAMHSLGGNGE